MKTSTVRVLAIVQTNVRTWFRNRNALFWTLLFPIILMVILGSIFGIQQNTFDLAIQNLDTDDTGRPTTASRMLIEAINSTKAFKTTLVDRDAEPVQYVKEKGLSRMLVIPEGFEMSIPRRNASLNFIYDSSQQSSQIALGILDALVNQVNARIANTPASLRIEKVSIISPATRYIDFFVPGVIGMSVATTGMFGALGTNTRYRQNGILRKLATTPLRKVEWILGMVLYEVFLAFISATVIGVAGTVLFGVRLSPSPTLLLLIFAGAMTFPGFGMIVAKFVRDEESADAAGNAITFPMMFMSGTFFPLEMMPEVVQQISKVLPLTYLNNGLRDVLILSRPESAILNGLILILVGGVFIIIGALVTSWREK